MKRLIAAIALALPIAAQAAQAEAVPPFKMTAVNQQLSCQAIAYAGGMVMVAKQAGHPEEVAYQMITEVDKGGLAQVAVMAVLVSSDTAEVIVEGVYRNDTLDATADEIAWGLYDNCMALPLGSK